MSDSSNSLQLIDGEPLAARNALQHHEQVRSFQTSARVMPTHPHETFVGQLPATTSFKPVTLTNAQQSQQQSFQSVLQPFTSVSHAATPSKQAGPVDLVKLAEGVRKAAGSANTTEKVKINFVHAW
jgi:hypothetical protein